MIPFYGRSKPLDFKHLHLISRDVSPPPKAVICFPSSFGHGTGETLLSGSEDGVLICVG